MESISVSTRALNADPVNSQNSAGRQMKFRVNRVKGRNKWDEARNGELRILLTLCIIDEMNFIKIFQDE